MNDVKLRAKLWSAVGEWFAEYYRELCDCSLSNECLIEKFIAEKGYTPDSSRTKVYAGRRIIKAGRGKDALNLITNSTNKQAVVFAQRRLNEALRPDES